LTTLRRLSAADFGDALLDEHGRWSRGPPPRPAPSTNVRRGERIVTDAVAPAVAGAAADRATLGP